MKITAMEWMRSKPVVPQRDVEIAALVLGLEDKERADLTQFYRREFERERRRERIRQMVALAAFVALIAICVAAVWAKL
jgi:hypothetical protein